MGTTKKKGEQTTTNVTGSHANNKEVEERKPIDSPDDNCRCKEVSEKTFPEMFKLMISDLSFWKKTNGKK